MLSERFTSRQHVPGDGVGDGREDPVELSERSSPVVESARNPATQRNTDGNVSAAPNCTPCRTADSQQTRRVDSAQRDWRCLQLQVCFDFYNEQTTTGP